MRPSKPAGGHAGTFAMKGMHYCFLMSIMAVLWFITTACRPSVPFHKGGELSDSEKASLAAIDPALVMWPIGWSAAWNQEGVFRRIYLDGSLTVGSTVMGYDKGILVFDQRGTVLVANDITFCQNCLPTEVLSVEPLRLKCGNSESATLRYSSEEGLQRLKRHGERRRAWYALWGLWEQHGLSRPHGERFAQSFDAAREWVEAGDTNIDALEKRLRDLGLLGNSEQGSGGNR